MKTVATFDAIIVDRCIRRAPSQTRTVLGFAWCPDSLNDVDIQQQHGAVVHSCRVVFVLDADGRALTVPLRHCRFRTVPENHDD